MSILRHLDNKVIDSRLNASTITRRRYPACVTTAYHLRAADVMIPMLEKRRREACIDRKHLGLRRPAKKTGCRDRIDQFVDELNTNSGLWEQGGIVAGHRRVGHGGSAAPMRWPMSALLPSTAIQGCE
jgi:hypothetical protein